MSKIKQMAEVRSTGNGHGFSTIKELQKFISNFNPKDSKQFEQANLILDMTDELSSLIYDDMIGKDAL